MNVTNEIKQPEKLVRENDGATIAGQLAAAGKTNFYSCFINTAVKLIDLALELLRRFAEFEYGDIDET
jgi:hypothetical protein